MTANIYGTPLAIALSFCILVALCGGRLLPTWMFLNSMQLILHVILIRTDMPSHAFKFMHDLLDKLRFKYDWSEEMTEESVGSSALSDSEVLKSSDTYSEHIKNCGYHYNWLNNLFIPICIACFIFVIWLLLLLKDYIMRRFMNKTSRNESFMANFSLRFLYEVIFEICFCTVLYLSFTKEANSVVLAICIVTAIAICASLIFCLSRGFKNGPYVKKCYEKGTLMKSFWSVRPINFHQL